MNHSVSHNRRWVLASRPQGAPVAENFRLETQPVPEPGRGSFCFVPSGCRWILICGVA
jgi:NADPH-dependent curcumin reductase CurA